MLEFEYRGGNTVVITTKSGVIVLDPRRSIFGLKDLLVKDAIELATEQRFATNNDDFKLNIQGPGDYGVSGFNIHGLAARRHLDDETKPNTATVYRVETLGIRVAVLGNIDPNLSGDQLEGVGVVDFLIIPVGGNGYTLDATSAAKLVHKIDPRVVIPVHYDDKDLKYEIPQASFEEFEKELAWSVERAAKYKIKGQAAIPATNTVLKLDLKI